VKDFKGITAQIKIPNNTEITRIEKVENILSQGATGMIFLSNSLQEINTTHRVIIDIVLLGTTNFGFSGSSPVCRIYYKTTDPITFEFISTETKLKNINNETMYIPICRESYTWIIN